MSEHLRIIANQYSPWMILDESYSNDCRGVSCEIIQYLSQSMNFSFEFIYQNAINTGYRLGNGTWTGAIGMIQSGVSYLELRPSV